MSDICNQVNKKDYAKWRSAAALNYLSERPKCEAVYDTVVEILDIYCTEFWSKGRGIDAPTWRMMERMVKDGKLTNFGIEKMDEMMRDQHLVGIGWLNNICSHSLIRWLIPPIQE